MLLKVLFAGVKLYAVFSASALVTDTLTVPVVQDSLKWLDHDIPAEVVRRVEFQHEARNYSDSLEGTVVEMMLK